MYQYQVETFFNEIILHLYILYTALTLLTIGTVGDGLTSGSHASRQSKKMSLSTTKQVHLHGISHDLLWSTTTPCAPLKQSGVLAVSLSLLRYPSLVTGQIVTNRYLHIHVSCF